MQERHKEIYTRLSRIAFPVVCAVALYLGYTRAQDRERLYWETPSIPFQPFCIEQDNWGPIRPIRGVKMSRKFIGAAIKALSVQGATMHAAFYKEDVSGNNPHPLLVTPKLFNDVTSMLDITREALNALRGTSSITVKANGKIIQQAAPRWYCKDVEGKVTEF